MKLINCHIENFGKLHDFSYDFTDGVNSLLQENGWGKSTLAAFIRVMFYGFDGESKRKESESERKRFAPWQGGTYGGQITFEAKGRTYRADRVFGKKADEDRFNLFDAETMKPSSDFSADLGSDLFEIDANSFERSVFIGQQDCATETTNQIQAKITNVSRDAADLANYDNAHAKLESIAKETSDRKADFQRLKQQIADLETSVRGKEALERSISDLTDRIAQLHAQITENTRLSGENLEEQKVLSNYLDLQNLLQRYEAVKAAREDASKKYEAEKAYFPGKIPGEAQVEEAFDLTAGLDADEKAEAAYRLEEEEKYQYERLCDKFKSAVPQESELDAMDEKVAELRAFEEEVAEVRPTAEELAKLEAESGKYEYYMPTIEELQKLSDDWRSAREKRETLQQRREHADALKELAEEKARANKPKFIWNLPLILGIVIGVLGILTLIAAVMPIGALRNMQTFLIIVGVVLFIGGIVSVGIGVLYGRKAAELGLKKLKVEYPEEYTKLAREISLDKDFIEGVSQDVEDMLKNGEIEYDQANAAESVTRMMDEIEAYLVLRNKKAKWDEGGFEDRLRTHRGNVTELMRKFFPNVADDGDFEQIIRETRYDVKEYERLRKKEENHKEALNRLTERQNGIERFFAAFGILMNPDIQNQIKEIRDHVKSCLMRESVWKEEEAKVADFEAKEDVSRLKDMPPQPKELSMEVLTRRGEELLQKGKELTADHAGCQKELDEKSDQLEQTLEDEQTLDAKKEELEEKITRSETARRTMEYLEKARDEFTKRYIRPVRAAFAKYYGMISGGEADFDIDSNLLVRMKEAGSPRATELLSEGNQDLVGLCRRLAMTDAMYEGEKPFLIFDDPFVNLDEKRLEGAVQFLREVGQSYQIIYLVCHESRTEKRG
ncbi:MAG: AAA family ATPase [Lachnospiraceae bacterium]|nr:AAA family ATPase [Lachnospiraceae bacterium]